MCLGKFAATVWKNASTWKLLPRWSYSVDTDCLLSPAKDHSRERWRKKTKCLVAQPHVNTGTASTQACPLLWRNPKSNIPHSPPFVQTHHTNWSLAHPTPSFFHSHPDIYLSPANLQSLPLDWAVCVFTWQIGPQ